MASTGRILVFAGSARSGSFNKKLAAAGAKALQAAGGGVTLIDLADYPAAIYSGDDEEATGMPQSMRDLKALIASHDAVMISTPEYNGCVPPLLVNVLSWTSRPDGDKPNSPVFRNKPVAIMATSPGGRGGIRVIPRLRDCLAEVGAVVIPGFVTVAGAAKAFDEDGNLVGEVEANSLKDLAERLIQAM